MKQLILRFYRNDVIRYVFFGGCTTLVNLVCFYVLRKLNVQLTVANLISIITAILFAYQCPSCDHDHRSGRSLASGGGTAYERYAGEICDSVHCSCVKLCIQ